VQSVSNSSRAYLLKDDIRWDILGFKLIGALPVAVLLAMVAFIPDKAILFIVLGLLPFLLWLPKTIFQGDAAKPVHAMFCGAVVMGLNLNAGVAGPALDFFLFCPMRFSPTALPNPLRRPVSIIRRLVHCRPLPT